jgi:hypothetical protein
MTQKPPPRYVPTLTQVVSSTERLAARSTGLAKSSESKPEDEVGPVLPDAQAVAQKLRLQLLAQTRQHVNSQLERRVREVVAQLALEHAHRLFEEMQPLLEATITQVIDEAVQKALQQAKTHEP